MFPEQVGEAPHRPLPPLREHCYGDPCYTLEASSKAAPLRSSQDEGSAPHRSLYLEILQG